MAVEAHREAVAEAIYESHRTSYGDVCWSHWPKLGELGREKYYAMADAAIQALGLKPNWGVGWRTFDGYENVIPRESRSDAQMLNMEHRYSDSQGYSVVSRLVSEWVGEQQ